MDPLQYAAQINNQGSSLLTAGNNLAAFECYRYCLYQLMLLGDYRKSCPSLLEAATPLVLHPSLYHRLLCANSGNSSGGNAHIFRKSFFFQPREDRRTCIASVLFNIAALFSSDCERSLRVALQLYDAGFDLLIDNPNCGVDDDLSTNLSLAILNNMAEIHWGFSDYEKASRVLELQKGLLDVIFSNKRQDELNFSEEEMEIFVLNTHLLQAPSGAAAA